MRRRRNTPHTLQKKDLQAYNGHGYLWDSLSLLLQVREPCTCCEHCPSPNPTLKTRGCVLVYDGLLDDPGLGSGAERRRDHHRLLLELRLELGPGLEQRRRALRRDLHLDALQLRGGGGRWEGLQGRLAVWARRVQGPAATAAAATAGGGGGAAAAALEGAAQGIRKQVREVPRLVADKLQHLCKEGNVRCIFIA